MKRRWLWVAAAVVAVVVIVLVFRAHRGAEASAPAPPAVTIAYARPGVFDVRVDAQGRIGAPAGSSSSLSFAVAGTIKSIEVRVGDRVTQGQQLARLEDTTFLLAVEQARGEAQSASAIYGGGAVPSAALRSAEARVRVTHEYLQRLEAGGPAAQGARAAAVSGTSQADLKVEADRRALARAQALYAGGIAAAKDVDAARSQLAADEADARALHAKAGEGAAGASVLAQARADYDQALADMRAAQAQVGNLAGQAQRANATLGQALSDYAKTVLRAPADGVVIRILKHPGEPADMTSPVVEIGPGAAASTTLYVPAADAHGIKIGDSVVLHLVRCCATATARVSAVVPAVDPTTQETTVVVGGMPSGAIPGDAVRGTITIDRRRGILVPTASIVQDPQTGKTLVFVRRKDGSGFDAREVNVAGSDDKVADVANGLSAGEAVAAHGAYELLAPAGG
jgi:multidrug efflux pump subunit AcrA (membrane-fusion protein)